MMFQPPDPGLIRAGDPATDRNTESWSGLAASPRPSRATAEALVGGSGGGRAPPINICSAGGLQS